MSVAKWDFLFFLTVAPVFLWIIAPPEGFTPKMPGVLRFIAGSAVTAILLTILLLQSMATEEFIAQMDSWVKLLASATYTDMVRAAFIENLTVENLFSAMRAIMLRGGSLVLCVFVFFINRQIGLIILRFNFNFRSRMNSLAAANAPGKNTAELKPPRSSTLAAFRVVPELIWVFSVSLFLVVLTRIFGFEIPEIILWNILLLCAMLYLAQGMGILQFFLLKPTTPVFIKLFLSVSLIVLFFSPVINAIVLAGLILLGIAENWVPLRAPKKNEPPSTPEAGENGR